MGKMSRLLKTWVLWLTTFASVVSALPQFTCHLHLPERQPETNQCLLSGLFFGLLLPGPMLPDSKRQRD